MKKSHEQEWKATPSGDVSDSVGLACLGAGENARFIAAAPKMARALMAAIYSRADTASTTDGPRMRLWLNYEDVEAMRDALREAGVLEDK